MKLAQNLIGKIGITATDGWQRISRFGCRLCAGAFAQFAAGAVAVGTVVADKVLAGGGNVTGDGGNERGSVESLPQALCGVIALAAIDDFTGFRDIGHLLQRERITQDVLSQFLKPVVVVPLDAVIGMNVESAVVPLKHLLGLPDREFLRFVGRLDSRIAALQYISMVKVLPISKRGTITLPPSFRKRMGINRVQNPLMLVREEDGKLIMELAEAVPVRDLAESTIAGWIAEDEAAGDDIRKRLLSVK